MWAVLGEIIGPIFETGTPNLIRSSLNPKPAWVIASERSEPVMVMEMRPARRHVAGKLPAHRILYYNCIARQSGPCTLQCCPRLMCHDPIEGLVIMNGLSTIVMLIAMCSIAKTAPMTFQYTGRGGNCSECEWIAADSDITSDTPNRFRKYLKEGVVVSHLHINSQGGDLAGGIELGRLFRANHIQVEVEGICVSACSYAFIGGETRNASAREIGIHQFSASLSNSGRPLVILKNEGGQETKTILSTTQAATAYIIEYVKAMGVDPGFVALASASQNVYYLTKSDLDVYKVRWEPKEFLPWGLRASGSGTYAYSQSRDRSLDIIVFCRSDKVPRLQITGLDSIQDLKERISSVHFAIFGTFVAQKYAQIKVVNNRPTIEIDWREVDLKSIKTSEAVLMADGPNSSKSAFQYKLTNEGARDNIFVALRNCI
jgi:hypothetical protein